MDIRETTYWNSCPVKNYGSVFYLMPRGNTTLLSGPFVQEIGLKYFAVDGAVVQVPHDENMRRLFEYQPGCLQVQFENFIRPFISIKQELTATGGDSFLLRYYVRNRAREDKEVTVVCAVQADRPVESLRKTEVGAWFQFDLRKRQARPGEGISDFSRLREWFIEPKDLEMSVLFESGQVATVQEVRVKNGQTQVLNDGLEVRSTVSVPAGQIRCFEMRLCFGAAGAGKMHKSDNEAKRHWESFATRIPAPHFADEDERLVYYKCWHVLFFNEVRQKGLHWCLTGLGFPSMWVWDTSPFIADAYLHVDPRFVQGLIEAQLASIKTSGMMPLHVILGLLDREERPDEITQIPLVAHTAWSVFDKTRDKAFAEKCHRTLTLNYEWYEQKRKPDRAVPLWGIDDRRAPYFYGPESGMDNCPIYRAGPAYSVAINAAKWSVERALSGFCAALDRPEEAAQWARRMQSTREYMLKHMWEEKDCYYYPLTYAGEKIRIKTSDLYPGLYLHLFPQEKVRALAAVLEEEFLTDYGLTTVSMQEDCFDPALYALGSVWPFMNYMVYRGLREAGCQELASAIFRGTVKALTDFPGVFECYDPVARQLGRIKDGPICFAHMSFCAAGVIAMFLLR